MQLDVSGSSSGIVGHYKPTQHIRTFVTHFSNCTELNNFDRPSYVSSFSPPYFLSEQWSHSLLHSSCTDVGRIPDFILIQSACQFWKGEAGQKIIGRTSHKSECEGSRCGHGGGCDWASPRPVSLLFSTEAISVVAITTIIHSCPCPYTHGRLSSSLILWTLWTRKRKNKLRHFFLNFLFSTKKIKIFILFGVRSDIKGPRCKDNKHIFKRTKIPKCYI